MNEELLKNYNRVRTAGGFYETKNGLIKVWGKEAARFLNGLITNDAAKLEENREMIAAFPNAQGRLLAVVRVIKKDDSFLFETGAATREKVYQNLFRFTFAGDFFVEDLTDTYSSFEITDFVFQNFSPENIEFKNNNNQIIFVANNSRNQFVDQCASDNVMQVFDELREILRIEDGVPKYGVDMDETTIVPELGIEGLINYNKGCYIGQEIIARIYFRGHVAKQLRGLIFEDERAAVNPGGELKSSEGKSAGKITSVTFSPRLGKVIALAYVRYDFLAEGTKLNFDDLTAQVVNLPFA